MAPTNPTHLEWPVEHPRACLGILHGLGDHAARYSEAAKAFNEMGIACLAAELPGHGRNPGPRGHIPSMDSAYATLDFMVEKCRATFPDLPIFLLGQSMGGNILLNYLLDRTPSVAGAIAMSPWIRLPNPPPRLLEMLARTMNLILPALTLSNGLDPRDLATSPAVAQAYIDDPLTHDRISFRTAVTMFDAAHRLDTFEGAFPVPVLLLHGEADRITDCKGTVELARRCRNVEWKTWAALHHELFNEAEAADVIRHIASWMNARIEKVVH